MLIHAVDHPEVEPFEMPARFKMEIVYFMTPGGEHGAPQLGTNEYWIRRDEAKKWLEDLVVSIMSPLDARSKADIELTEEHEAWLQWLVDHDIQHVRIEP